MLPQKQPKRSRLTLTRTVLTGMIAMSSLLGALLVMGSWSSSSRFAGFFAVVQQDEEQFPSMEGTRFPVSKVPDWGAMATAAEWNRRYERIPAASYVRLPRYDMQTLTIPMQTLLANRFSEKSIRILTAKLTYSTRYFAAYDLDAAEFTGLHPGIDLKLPAGMPVGAIAGGKVNAVRVDDVLGMAVIIEHRAREGAFYSVYGHLESFAVRAGENVRPGTVIGTVGMTGNTSAPHLHLQIDRGNPGETNHIPYRPESIPGPGDVMPYSVHPVAFIRQHIAN